LISDEPLATPSLRTSKGCQSIIIDRPIEVVFAAGSALDRRSEFRRGIVDGEWMDPDIAGLGARCTETRSTSAGEAESWELEITEFAQDDALTILASCDPVVIVERHLFERDRGDPRHTRYTLSLEVSGSSITGGAVQKQIVETLVYFREHVETPRARASVYRNDGSRLRRRVESEAPSAIALEPVP